VGEQITEIAVVRTTTGKFRKPSADENNRRTINGNVIFYHKKTERWIPDCFPLESKVTQEAVAVATVPLTTPTLVGAPPPCISTPQLVMVTLRPSPKMRFLE
jgi:hypothetical protein